VPITTLQPTTAQSRLKTFAAIAAVLAILQALLAVTILTTHNETLSHLHEGFGFLYAAAAVLCCFPAKVWGDLSRNKGLQFHAYGMAALGVIQVVLGLVGAPEEGQPMGPLIYLHMALGIAILLGAVALYVVAARKPIIVTNVDGTPRP